MPPHRAFAAWILTGPVGRFIANTIDITALVIGVGAKRLRQRAADRK